MKMVLEQNDEMMLMDVKMKRCVEIQQLQVKVAAQELYIC